MKTRGCVHTDWPSCEILYTGKQTLVNLEISHLGVTVWIFFWMWNSPIVFYNWKWLKTVLPEYFFRRCYVRMGYEVRAMVILDNSQLDSNNGVTYLYFCSWFYGKDIQEQPRYPFWWPQGCISLPFMHDFVLLASSDCWSVLTECDAFHFETIILSTKNSSTSSTTK